MWSDVDVPDPQSDREVFCTDLRSIIEDALKPRLADMSGTLCADVRAEMRQILKEVQAMPSQEPPVLEDCTRQNPPASPVPLEPEPIKANRHEWTSRHIRGYSVSFFDHDGDQDDDHIVYPPKEFPAPPPPQEAWHEGSLSPARSGLKSSSSCPCSFEGDDDMPRQFRVKSLPRLLRHTDNHHSLGDGDSSGALGTFKLTYGLRKMVMPLVKSQSFDYVMFMLILVNAICLGVQTNHLATTNSREVPMVLRGIEVFFAVVFTAEMLLRFFVYGFGLFRRAGWKWNVFDCCVVGLQLVELTFTEVPNLSFLRVARMLRLVRVIRLIRILRHISELRTLVASIGLSLKSLGWTAIILLVMIYMVSLMITEVVSAKFSDMDDGTVVSDDALKLQLYFGSLGRSMLSMFQAISGGLDWDTIVSPLISEISDWHAMIFVLYVAFAQLAMMNVVTGVFVESVLTSAQKDRDLFMINNVRELFQEVDGGIAGVLDWEVFQSKLDTRQMQEFFKAINVDSSEAPGLFRLLDIDSSGEVNAEEFLSGCLRLRGPAKALDLALLVREVGKLESLVRGR